MTLRHTPTFVRSLSIISALAFASPSIATNFPETEANNTKAQALANAAFVLASGDSISGTSNTTSENDYFLIKTPPMPLGLYRHKLVLTTAIGGHTMTIQGLTQTAAGAGQWPGPVGSASAEGVVQTAAAAGSNPNQTRTVQWYGFGKEERLYVKVVGTAATTQPYTATLTTTDETANITTVPVEYFTPGVITLTTSAGSGTNDNDMIVYDSGFNTIPGFLNDSSSTNGGGTTSLTFVHLRRLFTPGVYYVAIGLFNLANNLPSPCDDNFRTGAMMDFPDVLVRSSATAPVNSHYDVIDAVGTTRVNARSETAFEILWAKIIVGDPPAVDPIFGACCLSSGSCVRTYQSRCVTVAMGTFQGVGTACGTCPPIPAGQWVARKDAPYWKAAGAGAIVGNTFYLLGGANNLSRTTPCFKYDIVNDDWSSIAPMPASGVSPANQVGGISNISAATIGTDVYIVGGYPGANPPLARLLRYDTVANTWEVVTSDPYPSTNYGAGLAAVGGKLYAISGNTNTTTPSAACYVYDPAAAPGTRWAAIASIPVGRPLPAVIPLDGKIYAVGAEATTNEQRLDIYDLATDAWTQGPDTMQLRGATALFNLNGNPYAASGGQASYTTTGEVFASGAWGAGPSVINGARSCAAAGNANWLVRATGYNGSYLKFTEVYRFAGPTGACCASAGTCSVSEQLLCSGAYQGNGSACDPNPCPQPQVGVCCQNDGMCTPATPGIPNATCATGNLVVNGTCTPNTCPPPASGACCRGSTCSTSVAQVDCTATAPAGAAFVPTATQCNAMGNSTTPCCHADFNKSGAISVQDIFDFLGAWFAGSPFARVGSDGSASSLTVQNIFDFLGVWFAGGC